MHNLLHYIPDEQPWLYSAVDAEHAAKELQLQQMVRALCNLDSDLSSWEVDFVESMSHLDGGFTSRQAEKIEELFDRYC